MVLQKTHAAAAHTRSLTQVLLTSCSHLVFFIAQPALFTLAFMFSLSLFAHSVSHSLGPSTIHHLTRSQSDTYWKDLSMKKGRKRQHPPSNTVNAEWSCVLWWQSIYTWEEGYWYWDRSNIAANKGLLPGKLEKRWWTVEEIYEGLTINFKQKNANNST